MWLLPVNRKKCGFILLLLLFRFCLSTRLIDYNAHADIGPTIKAGCMYLKILVSTFLCIIIWKTKLSHVFTYN
jgi:hypothetical protein